VPVEEDDELKVLGVVLLLLMLSMLGVVLVFVLAVVLSVVLVVVVLRIVLGVVLLSTVGQGRNKTSVVVAQSRWQHGASTVVDVSGR